MRLVANWRAVLRHAWSVWLLALFVLLQAAEVALPNLYGVLPISDTAFKLLSLAVAVAALVARFIHQKKLDEERD